MSTRTIWHFGNTSVRSPFRLRDGLVALSQSPLQGNLRGSEQEIAFRNLLGQQGLVKLGDDVTYSVGRKWRSALTKLGFLYPQVPGGTGLNQSSLGQVDTITPNGWRLVENDSLAAMQECFLRSLAAYYIPSVLESDYSYAVFSPLKHVLRIMLELERQAGESTLKFLEMGVVVQASSNDVVGVVERLLTLRNQREQANNKKHFDQEQIEAAHALHGYASTTFSDYADTNFRYLRATGLVQNKGKGIILVPQKRKLIEQLAKDTTVPETHLSYLTTLCNGAILPIDDKGQALEVLSDLVTQLNARGLTFDLANKKLDTPADIAVVRHEIEAILFENNEEAYAVSQAQAWQEIAAYMGMLSSRRWNVTLTNGEEITIPRLEAPAYFEWVLWRAFLAIDNLRNKPYKARRFKVDQDFLPIGNAPGNGPDMIFEFDEFILAVEVTLTESSRQEAAEGEPVRRHVANLVEQYSSEGTQKRVYGLFLANQIDSNTAETFRIGVWYRSNDVRMRLDIVPMTLSQFKTLFEALFSSNKVSEQHVLSVLNVCGDLRGAHEAPEWKQRIATAVSEHSQQLMAA